MIQKLEYAQQLQAQVIEANAYLEQLGGEKYGIKAVLNNVIGIPLEWSNRSNKPKPERFPGQYSQAIHYFENMNLPPYSP